MASVGQTIKVELYFKRLLDALGDVAETWTEETAEKFAAEWKALEAAGSEIFEIRMFGDRFVAYPSDDFTQHCARYGAHSS